MQRAPDCCFACSSSFFFKCPKSFQRQENDLRSWNSDHHVETEIDSHPVKYVNEKNCYLASFDEMPFDV